MVMGDPSRKSRGLINPLNREPEHLPAATPGASDLPRRIHALGASAIMVGIMVGSGIFRTPPEIAGQLGSPWIILLAWLIGGLVSLLGALTYAELACLFPRSGGIYVFLHEGLGPGVAFVFGWTYMLITKPSAAAAIAVVFAEHVNHLLGVQWDERVVVTVILVALTLVNTFRVEVGEGVAGLLTGVKVMALVGVIVLALVLWKGSPQNLEPAPIARSFLTAMAPVFMAIMWTYDGWSDVAAIAGEVRNPQRSLPRILLLGTGLVTLLYVAVNLVYHWMIPLEEMRRVDTVAPLVAERLIGPAGGTIATLLILLSTIGSTHGSIITGARVTFGQARDGLLFRFLARMHPRHQTPDVALWTQCGLSCVAVWVFTGFENLTAGFVFTMWIFYALAAAGVIVLRIRCPHAARPYRCWGYPVVPLLFILVALGMTVLIIMENPRQTLPWLALLAAGAPMYCLWRRFAPAPAADDARND